MDDLRVVDPREAQWMTSHGALLLDVRETLEWDAGHAPGARHVPLGELPDRLDELAGAESIVCVCRTGVRSRRAARFLLEHDVAAVNLDGGMVAWVEEGGPLEADANDPTIL